MLQVQTLNFRGVKIIYSSAWRSPRGWKFGAEHAGGKDVHIYGQITLLSCAYAGVYEWQQA